MAYFCSNNTDFKKSHVHRILIYVTHRQLVDIDICQEVPASNPERRVTLLKEICLYWTWFEQRCQTAPTYSVEVEGD